MCHSPIFICDFFYITAPIAQTSRPSTRVFAEDDFPINKGVERGVSIDQDGKSNVWAVEPRGKSIVVS